MEKSRPLVFRWRRAIIATTLVAAFATSMAVWQLSAADLTRPTTQDRRITLMVRHLLKQEHLFSRAVDDTTSERGMKSFLKSLDPLKVYFYQSDIDEFKRNDKKLDDMMSEGDITFAYTVFNRFLKRVDERVATIDGLLKNDFDFTLDEEMVVDGDAARYPRNAAEAKNRWRQRLKYDLLDLESDKTTGAEARDKLKRRYTNFARRMQQTDSDELLEMYLTALTTSFDPHTTYMSKTSLENFRILMRLNLEGIGASLKSEDGYTIVAEVIPGGAADKQGKLATEDRIVSVGQGESGEMVDVVDMKLSDVVKLIRGEKGTIVRLGVIPASGSGKAVYQITRARIELRDSEARGDVKTIQTANGKVRVGVINLPSFYMDMEAARRNLQNYKSTTRDVRKILDEFKQKEVDVVLLDLRRNGGGSLTEAINLTGLFINDGPVVQVKDGNGRVHTFDDEDKEMVWSGPLVVATSKFSASASEILAGAIQDYKRGIIVGDESTHGKGTVQSLLDLGSQFVNITKPPQYGALKITMQQFYRPSGDSTQKRGVLADIVLPSLTNHMDIGEGDLPYAVEFDKVPVGQFKPFAMVRPGMKTELQNKSQTRISGDDDFAKLSRNIEKYKKQKANKTVTLNRKKFMAEREDVDASKEDDKQLEKQNKAAREVFPDNFYNDELMKVTVDYLKALGNQRVARSR
jgi:carboxyl-terminal processing protease